MYHSYDALAFRLYIFEAVDHEMKSNIFSYRLKCALFYLNFIISTDRIIRLQNEFKNRVSNVLNLFYDIYFKS